MPSPDDDLPELVPFGVDGDDDLPELVPFGDEAPPPVAAAPDASPPPAPIAPSKPALAPRPAPQPSSPGDESVDAISGLANGLLMNWGDEMSPLGEAAGNAVYAWMNPDSPANNGSGAGVNPLRDAQKTDAGQYGQMAGNIVSGLGAGALTGGLGGYAAQAAIGGATNLASGIGAREGSAVWDPESAVLDGLIGAGAGAVGRKLGNVLVNRAAAKAAAKEAQATAALTARRPAVSRFDASEPAPDLARYPRAEPYAPPPRQAPAYPVGELDMSPSPRALPMAARPAPAPPRPPPPMQSGLDLDVSGMPQQPSGGGLRELDPTGRAYPLELDPAARPRPSATPEIDAADHGLALYKRPPRVMQREMFDPRQVELPTQSRTRVVSLDNRVSPPRGQSADAYQARHSDAGGQPPELAEWEAITRDMGSPAPGDGALDLPGGPRLELDVPSPPPPAAAPDIDLSPQPTRYRPYQDPVAPAPFDPRATVRGTAQMQPLGLPEHLLPTPTRPGLPAGKVGPVDPLELPASHPDDLLDPVVHPDSGFDLQARAVRAELAKAQAKAAKNAPAPPSDLDHVMDWVKGRSPMGRAVTAIKFLKDAFKPAPAQEIEVLRRAQAVSQGLESPVRSGVAAAQKAHAGPDVPTLTWAIQSATSAGARLPPSEQEALDQAIMSGDGTRISSAYMRASMRNPGFQKQVTRQIERANSGE